MFNRSRFNGLKFGRIIVASGSPIITLVSVTRKRISKQDGANTSKVTFTSSLPLIEWEARANSVGPGTGLLVGNGGNTPANTDTYFDIDWNELEYADKNFKINIFGRNERGWSIYE